MTTMSQPDMTILTEQVASHIDTGIAIQEKRSTENWVDEALNKAAEVVMAWPEWMRRPEVRRPGYHGDWASRH